MRHLIYTYVDAVNGIPCTLAPLRNGPVAPSVPGLQHGFALESRYPTGRPVFYGTAPDVDAATPGVLEVITEEQYAAAEAQEMEDRAAISAARLEQWRNGLVISRFQALAKLADLGLLDAIEQAMSGPDATDRQRLAWRHARDFRRMSPTVLWIVERFGLADELVDTWFIEAQEIEA